MGARKKCTKVGYPTADAARDVALAYKRRSGMAGFRTYRCTDKGCRRQWHWTHAFRREGRPWLQYAPAAWYREHCYPAGAPPSLG